LVDFRAGASNLPLPHKFGGIIFLEDRAMKDLISAAILAFICISFWAAIPIFAIIAGTGVAILFLKYIIQASKEYDEQKDQ
jgi:hypothetical protein